MTNSYNIDEKIIKLAETAEKELATTYKKYEDIAFNWSARVLKAFQNNWLSTADFAEVTGYGYSDGGRDKLEAVYSQQKMP